MQSADPWWWSSAPAVPAGAATDAAGTAPDAPPELDVREAPAAPGGAESVPANAPGPPEPSGREPSGPAPRTDGAPRRLRDNGQVGNGQLGARTATGLPPPISAPPGTSRGEPFAGFGPPPQARFADRRGLTGLGAALVAVAFGIAGGLFDALRASMSDTAPLHISFVAFFAVGSLLAVLAVHRDRVRVAMTAPPLVYLLGAVISGLTYAARNGFPLVGKDAATTAAAALFNLAPELVGVTALTVLIGWLRHRSGRRGSAPAG